ncbi:hypothetical protein [Kribbella endophytica]
MPNRLTRPGALAYAFIAVTLGAQAVHLLRLDGVWGTDQTWVAVTLLAISLVSGVLFAASALTRTPLVESAAPDAGDAHLLSRFGAWAVIGLTVVGVLVVTVGDLDAFGLWPNLPAVFTPFWVRRLETSYFEGVEETRRAAAADL